MLTLYLFNFQVAFVAITNHVLDAAKTNRAVCLCRTQTTRDDLFKLAEVFFPNVVDEEETSRVTENLLSSEDITSLQQNSVHRSISNFIDAYYQLKTSDETENFRNFFGLRDFIHFLSYLYRKLNEKEFIEPKDVAEAVERNFNGKYFDSLVRHFLSMVCFYIHSYTVKK